MNEKVPNINVHNESEDNKPTQAHESSPIRALEPDSNREQELRRTVSDALLKVVYGVARNPGEGARYAAAQFALGLVHLTYPFDLTSDADNEELERLAYYVGDRLIELAAVDDLTTSDLQGIVEALALRLVRQQLPVGDVNPPSDPAM